MTVNYTPTDPVAGQSRSTAPTEVQRWTDYADTIADVDTRLDTLEAASGGGVKQGTRLTHSATPSMTASSWYSHPFDAETVDDGGWHDTATNNTRITFAAAGWRNVWGVFDFANTGSGGAERHVRILLNGATVIGESSHIRFASATRSNAFAISLSYKFAAGDYIELQGFADAANPVNLKGLSQFGAIDA